jgi:hypothetical protein
MADLDYSELGADAILNMITTNRAAIARLEIIDTALLDRLDQLAEAGEVDQGGFSHNDWGFAYCAGRKSWEYPEDIKEIETILKTAKKTAEGNGSATPKTGAPFWTIKPPKF